MEHEGPGLTPSDPERSGEQSPEGPEAGAAGTRCSPNVKVGLRAGPGPGIQLLHLLGRVSCLCSEKSSLHRSLLSFLANVGLLGYGLNRALWAGMGALSLFTTWYLWEIAFQVPRK